MATVTCPSCGRFNIVDELAARGFTCELCRGTVPVADELLQNISLAPSPLPSRAHAMPVRPQPLKGDYPISRVCPNCGSAEYKQLRPERLIAFTWDRICRTCETRYTPPTPTWAAVVFLFAGTLLAGFGCVSLVVGIVTGKLPALPAMACEGFLGFLGLLAIVQGLRALIKPGRA